MQNVEQFACEVEQGLQKKLPGLRKTVSKKLSLAVAAMSEARTTNTATIAHLLPLETDNARHRQQWLRRLLKNDHLIVEQIMQPYALHLLHEIAQKEHVIMLSMDQVDVGGRFKLSTISVRVGSRTMPLAWSVGANKDDSVFAEQQIVLERIQKCLPSEASVLLLADQIYPSEALLRWIKAHHWGCRLKCGRYDASLTADESGFDESFYSNHQLGLEHGLSKDTLQHVGIFYEPVAKAPWVVTIDHFPMGMALMEYRTVWSTEPAFSDFMMQGFGLEDTHLEFYDRIERLMLIMALAMYFKISL